MSHNTTTDFVLPSLDGAIVEYYGCGRARVVSPFLHEEVRSELSHFEAELEGMAGVRHRDNHVVYGLLSKDGKITYVWFHDFGAFFGAEVHVGGY